MRNAFQFFKLGSVQFQLLFSLGENHNYENVYTD